MNPTGKLYTSNPAGLKKIDFPTDILLITRAGFDIPGTELIRELSPSSSLFQTYLDRWKNRPGSEWWSEYEKRFEVELGTQEKVDALRDVYKRLLKGKNVVLVCFCNDHRYCHRRLVGEFFEKYGVIAEELNPITSEQLSLF